MVDGFKRQSYNWPMKKDKAVLDFARVTVSMPGAMARYVEEQARLFHYGNVSGYFRSLIPPDWRGPSFNSNRKSPKNGRA